jgi:LytS/YehU family sensor histidine kinase
LLACYISCVLARTFIVKICEPLAGVPPKAFETYANILTDVPKLLYVYLLDIVSVAVLFTLLKVMKDQLLIQKRTLLLEKEKAETELQLLKTQLNPHFLFNTLNNIYSLSFISAVKTSESIARLADILDHILYRCNQPFVPLSAEVAVMRNYIELERLRYDDRLTVNFHSVLTEDIPIAPLVLLSLVENAFKHGAGEDAGAPEVEIQLNVSRSRLCFQIANTVVEPQADAAPGERIGLRNLRQQLDLIYGDAHQLAIGRRGNWFVVDLTIERKPERTGYEKNKVFAGG